MHTDTQLSTHFALCRWLVGLSYRLVYFRDPVPQTKGKRNFSGSDELVHVHGEMFVDDATCCPNKLMDEADVDISDHSWPVYQGVCACQHATAQLHIDMELASSSPETGIFAKPAAFNLCQHPSAQQEVLR